MAEVKTITPAEVEAKALEFQELSDKVLEAVLAAREAQEPFEKLKEELVELVRTAGSAHAEKSKILIGIEHEIMATFGTSYTQDGAAIERFRMALVKAKQSRLLKRMFQKDVRWTLLPEAATIVRDEEKKLSKSLRSLYSQISIPKAKTPTVIVRPQKK